jgi:hypothetical protein
VTWPSASDAGGAPPRRGRTHVSFDVLCRAIGFQYQDEGDPYFRNEKNVLMYHFLYFSRDPAGLTIWRNIKKIEPRGQRVLPFT